MPRYPERELFWDSSASVDRERAILTGLLRYTHTHTYTHTHYSLSSYFFVETFMCERAAPVPTPSPRSPMCKQAGLFPQRLRNC